MPKKISPEKVRKLESKSLLRLINLAKAFVKTDPTFVDLCKKHQVPTEIINYIPMMFKDLDVSAKTDHGIIYLNYKMLEDGDFLKDIGYLVHESTHFLQQCFGEKPLPSAENDNYLKDPYEVEGFKNQIKFISDNLGKSKAKEYTENLVDYHDINLEEQEDVKNNLLDLVD